MSALVKPRKDRSRGKPGSSPFPTTSHKGWVRELYFPDLTQVGGQPEANKARLRLSRALDRETAGAGFRKGAKDHETGVPTYKGKYPGSRCRVFCLAPRLPPHL